MLQNACGLRERNCVVPHILDDKVRHCGVKARVSEEWHRRERRVVILDAEVFRAFVLARDLEQPCGDLDTDHARALAG